MATNNPAGFKGYEFFIRYIDFSLILKMQKAGSE
jgi:hypothetical protein